MQSTETFIVMSEAVSLETQPPVIPAVVGAVLNEEILREVLFNMSYTTVRISRRFPLSLLCSIPMKSVGNWCNNIAIINE